MTKVRIERCLIKRGGETFFEFEREFACSGEAEDCMERCVDLYHVTGRVHECNGFGGGYELILAPSYHRVYLRLV